MKNVLTKYVKFKKENDELYIIDTKKNLYEIIDVLFGAIFNIDVDKYSSAANNILYDKILSRLVSDLFLTLYPSALDNKDAIKIKYVGPTGTNIISVARFTKVDPGYIDGIINI